MRSRDLLISDDNPMIEILLDIRDLLVLCRDELALIRRNTRKEPSLGIEIPTSISKD